MKLGIIAGKGDVPRLIAEDRLRRGEDTFIIMIKGFEEAWMKTFDHELCGIAETGKMLKALRNNACDTLTFIGNIKRPDFSRLKPDLKAVTLLPQVLKEATKGDDALLRALVKIFEDEGFSVVGAQDVLAPLKCQSGYLSQRRPSDTLIQDIRHAYTIAGDIGRLDIGQGVVVANGIVLAVEAQEGTDQMLKRVSNLPQDIRGDEDEQVGVLLKRPKPIQERRVDLPTIGPETVRRAAEAGLAGVVFVEDGILIVNRDEIVSLADELGLCLICLQNDGSLP